MKTVLQEFLWGPPVSNGEYAKGQDMRWRSDGDFGDLGNPEAWVEPRVEGARSLAFLPLRGNDLVTFREIVPRVGKPDARPGLLVHGVLLEGHMTSATEALELRKQLKLNVVRAAELGSRQGGTPSVVLTDASPMTVSSAGLDLNAVLDLRCAIIAQTPDHAALAVVGTDESTIFEHCRAAMTTLPRELLRGYYFSTLEAAYPDSSLRLVGVIEQGWIGGAPDRQFSTLIRISTPSDQPTWLRLALQSTGSLHYLQTAPTAADWNLRDSQVRDYFNGGPVAPALASALILSRDVGALTLRERNLGPAVDALVDEEDQATISILRAYGFLGQAVAARVGGTLKRHSDDFLANVLPSLSGDSLRSFWTAALAQAATGSEWHPGCAEPMCPVRAAVSDQLQRRDSFLDEVLRQKPALVPLALRPPADALAAVLHGHAVPSDTLTPPIHISVQGVEKALAERVAPDDVAVRLHALLSLDPRLEEETHRALLSSEATFDFASGPYMRVIADSTPTSERPGRMLTRLFDPGSLALRRWPIPSGAQRYLCGPVYQRSLQSPQSLDSRALDTAFRNAEATQSLLSDVLTRIEPQLAREVFWEYRTLIAGALGIPVESSPLWLPEASAPSYMPPTGGYERPGAEVTFVGQGSQAASSAAPPWPNAPRTDTPESSRRGSAWVERWRIVDRRVVVPAIVAVIVVLGVLLVFLLLLTQTRSPEAPTPAPTVSAQKSPREQQQTDPTASARPTAKGGQPVPTTSVPVDSANPGADLTSSPAP